MRIRTRLFNLVLILGMLFGALGTVTQEASAATSDLFIPNTLRAAVLTRSLRSIMAQEDL